MGTWIHGINYEYGQTFRARVAGNKYQYGSSDVVINTFSAGETITFYRDVGSSYWHRYEINYIGKGYIDEHIFPYAQYAITFDAHGGSGGVPVVYKTWGTPAYVPNVVPALSGYDFVCWNTNPDGTGATYVPGQSLPDMAMTLHAIWKSAGTIRVKVNGTWRQGVPYVKVNGVWKRGIAHAKVNGYWKRGV